MLVLDRRSLMLAALAAAPALAGCSAVRESSVFGALLAEWPREGRGPVVTPDYAKVYGPVRGERHPVKAFDFADVDPGLLRADVAYSGSEPPDTIVVDPRHHRLFLVEPAGRATRYGIAVGPEAKDFFGQGVIAARRVWPDYAPSAPRAAFAQFEARPTPTPRPGATTPGGPKSPRGARALYLAVNGQDAGFVIHGTPEPGAIGGAASAGCIGLVNQDMIDLYRRTREGMRIVVLA